MNRTILIGLAGLLVTGMCTACNRHVTVEPELVPSLNQADWNILSAPAPAPPSQGTAPIAPAAGQPSPAAPPAPQAPVVQPPS
jgi:hypothetical protein